MPEDRPLGYADDVRPFVHGAQADDPVPNESECCFPCSYHSCMVVTCDICHEMTVWHEDPDRWRHIDPPEDGHSPTWGPPEHWAWILEQRALDFDGSQEVGPCERGCGWLVDTDECREAHLYDGSHE